MKLVEKNIAFVKQMTRDGVTYEWFVVMKDHAVSSARKFVVETVDDHTKVEFYKENLPKAVQNFLKKHSPREFSVDYWRGSKWVHYIYEA